MRHSKVSASLALLAGTAALSPGLFAEDRDRAGWSFHDDRRDVRFDHVSVDRMRAIIARDRFRLEQDLRAGRDRAAAEDARDLARDQRAFRAQFRDVQLDGYRDEASIYGNRRDLDRGDYREFGRNR